MLGPLKAKQRKKTTKKTRILTYYYKTTKLNVKKSTKNF